MSPPQDWGIGFLPLSYWNEILTGKYRLLSPLCHSRRLPHPLFSSGACCRFEDWRVRPRILKGPSLLCVSQATSLLSLILLSSSFSRMCRQSACCSLPRTGLHYHRSGSTEVISIPKYTNSVRISTSASFRGALVVSSRSNWCRRLRLDRATFRRQLRILDQRWWSESCAAPSRRRAPRAWCLPLYLM